MLVANAVEDGSLYWGSSSCAAHLRRILCHWLLSRGPWASMAIPRTIAIPEKYDEPRLRSENSFFSQFRRKGSLWRRVGHKLSLDKQSEVI